MLDRVLKEIGLANSTIEVYLRLLELGSASARQLAENVGMPRPSVYDHLRILLNNGLIFEQNEENKNVYYPNDIKHLKSLVKQKIESLQEESRKIEDYIPKGQIKNVEPKTRYFFGADGIKQILKDLSWYENTEILSMWPVKEMLNVLGDEALADFNKRRIKNNNPIRGIWPSDKAIELKKYPFIGVGRGHLRKLRIAPKKMTWNMGHAIYDDKVAFISSKKEAFGFILRSQDFADLMRVQFEEIWEKSKNVNYKSPANDIFLEKIL